MSSADSISARFREARERAGLSHDEVAKRMGISSPSIWDIESDDQELFMCYSIAKVQRFCSVLGIGPRDLFAIHSTLSPITPAELAELIREHCRSRSIGIEQLEEACSWSIAKSLDEPERFRHDYPIDGVRHICRELGIDWGRVILSL